MTARRGFADGSNSNMTKEWRGRGDGGRSTGGKKGREKKKERVMRGARDAGSAWCTKKRRKKERERGEGRAMEKTERGDKEIRT